MTEKQDQSQPPLDRGCIVFCVLASIFFLAVDSILGWGVTRLLGLGK